MYSENPLTTAQGKDWAIAIEDTGRDFPVITIETKSGFCFQCNLKHLLEVYRLHTDEVLKSSGDLRGVVYEQEECHSNSQ